MFSPKCKGCDRPVMDNYLSALHGVWHPECFVCGVSVQLVVSGMDICSLHCKKGMQTSYAWGYLIAVILAPMWKLVR